jgi:RNA polymerase sigma factor (TIGR02999 family)
LEPPPADVTFLLNQMAEGDQEAAQKLYPLIYNELRGIAARYLRRERPNHTLEPTALVHEAYLKFSSQRITTWQNRAQFFALASQAMRRILVDHARARARLKRGGEQQKLSLVSAPLAFPYPTEELLGVDEALSQLEQFDAQQGRIVELRYFGGLTVEETAKVLSVSSKTVQREWGIAKAWLYGKLKERHRDDARELEQDQGAV